MNRKRKKQMKIVAVVLFFLITGIGYVVWSGLAMQKENGEKLSGVLSATEAKAVEEPVEQETHTIGEEPEELVVYVCGAVNSPGIYTLVPDGRLYEAIALAGGFSADADPAYHNLARNVSDGERIYILSSKETKELSVQQRAEGEEGEEREGEPGGLLNLNTATVEQLMELPGIGEAKAEGILEYRAKIGQFTAIEEIRNVSGIGEAMYEKMKDKITVK